MRAGLMVIRGDATAEEIAAVVAVLASRAGTTQTPPDEAPPTAWGHRADLLRRPLSPGPGAWRSSALRP